MEPENERDEEEAEGEELLRLPKTSGFDENISEASSDTISEPEMSDNGFEQMLEQYGFRLQPNFYGIIGYATARLQRSEYYLELNSYINVVSQGVADF